MSNAPLIRFIFLTLVLLSIWAIFNKKLYDLTDYVLTLDRNNNAGIYDFLDRDIVSVFQNRAGQDITEPLQKVLDRKSERVVKETMNCLDNAFYWGTTDFRKTPRCQVQNYMLIIASVILMSSMVLKCASLVLGF